jgi:hypothetical protein
MTDRGDKVPPPAEGDGAAGDDSEEFAMPTEGTEAAQTDEDEFAMPTGRLQVARGEDDEFAMPGEWAEMTRTESDEYAMPAAPRAVRLTFTYEGDEISLISRQPVEMVVMPTDPISGREVEVGSWVEVRNHQETTLYRRVMPQLFRRDVEVFSPDPQASISRSPQEAATGQFSVIVPELEQADHVVLLSSAGPTRVDVSEANDVAGFAGAVEVARFALPRNGGGDGNL